ncbi:protein of unknown function [Colwellia chukchiensis]|uniref:DUF4386 domain-containing protein n=1 Tax=Colwellia chukchiensis TaxID=641665 RepID=A0A1H7M9S5_9GAMM|nr:DUF4386 family protein [Colwellia chukchiensis]SEL08080.1 protein of unknown function [Colwellia chukchiensis]
MSLLKWGGLAAIVEACTYIFGFILFFGILNTTGLETPKQYLSFVIEHRDSYFLGYLISGILFSLALIILVHATYQTFKQVSPEFINITTIIGYLWAGLVLASSLIFLSSLGPIAKYHAIDPDAALVINRSITIVVDALGGGIELVGALWVLAISYVGLKGKIFSQWLHYWGVLVGLAGVLTIFAGFSFLADNGFFSTTTAIFGLGQIVWFLGLGFAMLNAGAKQA